MSKRQSRKVIWDMINTLFVTTEAVEPTFVASFSTRKLCPWPSVRFFQFSLKNSTLKANHNTFRDCRVHFFRQPFQKQLYTEHCNKKRNTRDLELQEMIHSTNHSLIGNPRCTCLPIGNLCLHFPLYYSTFSSLASASQFFNRVYNTRERGAHVAN